MKHIHRDRRRRPRRPDQDHFRMLQDRRDLRCHLDQNPPKILGRPNKDRPERNCTSSNFLPLSCLFRFDLSEIKRIEFYKNFIRVIL